MPGPAPKFDPVRKGRNSGPVYLPREGRQGPPPMWPVPDQMPTALQWAVWVELWRSPQALQWERMGIATSLVVARYCDLLVRCTNPKASSVIHGQASMLEDKLGLTPKAMRTLLWEIQDEPEEQVTKFKSVNLRDRMKATDN